MSSQGPYGRHGYATQGGGAYDGAQSGYAAGGGYGGGGYGGAAGGYGGGGYGGSAYSAAAPMAGYPPMQGQPPLQGGSSGYGSGDVGIGAASGYQSDSDDNKHKIGKKSTALKAINQNIIMWAAFFTASMLIYFFLSSADFSFIMTYGALSRMFGFGILIVKMFKTKKSTGISAKTLQLYCITFACRLFSIMRHEGYLPYDKSGDWLYHVIEFLSLAFTGAALYCTLVAFRSSYQKEFDKFGELNVPSGLGAIYLIIPCFLLACCIHPGLNQDFLSDVSWTFAMYLETAALVPQLYMFQKQTNGVVELLTAHFVAALGFGRILEFVFWLYSYHELAHKSGSNMAGYMALFAQFSQILLMLDFFWYYYQAVKNATPLVLPQHNSLGVV